MGHLGDKMELTHLNKFKTLVKRYKTQNIMMIKLKIMKLKVMSVDVVILQDHINLVTVRLNMIIAEVHAEAVVLIETNKINNDIKMNLIKFMSEVLLGKFSLAT